MNKLNYINTILIVISIVFSAGMYLTKINAQEDAIQEIRLEYVRKDVLEVELRKVNENLDRIYSELKELNGGR